MFGLHVRWQHPQEHIFAYTNDVSEVDEGNRIKQYLGARRLESYHTAL